MFSLCSDHKTSSATHACSTKCTEPEIAECPPGTTTTCVNPVKSTYTDPNWRGPGNPVSYSLRRLSKRKYNLTVHASLLSRFCSSSDMITSHDHQNRLSFCSHASSRGCVQRVISWVVTLFPLLSTTHGDSSALEELITENGELSTGRDTIWMPISTRSGALGEVSHYHWNRVRVIFRHVWRASPRNRSSSHWAGSEEDVWIQGNLRDSQKGSPLNLGYNFGNHRPGH